MSGVLLLIIRFLIIFSLYAFFAWALYVLWRDLQKHGLTHSQNKIPTLSLYSEQYTQEENFQFYFPEIIVGRSPAVDCTIDAEVVSIRHARLFYTKNQWWVEDLKSTNGTYLNGEDVVVPTILKTGDILSFGNLDFIVAITQGAPAR